MWLCLCGHYCYNAALATIVVEIDGAVNECIEGVVAAHADVLAGIVNSTSLAYYDVACYTSLATIYLYA